MDTTNKQEGSLFWKLQDVEPAYWDEYIVTRPIYDQNIFHRIYDYHGSHSGFWRSALDIGTGSGSAIVVLAEKFQRVVASDNDSTSLAFAQRRYAHISAEQISYTLSSGEDLCQHHPPGSFDLITCAETFPLLDTQIALDNMFTLLQPGGTLAIWFYGPPFFTEPDIAPKCQPILDSIMDRNFRPVVSGGGEAWRASWKRAADGMFSWLDYIPFSHKRWRNVRRHKWNPHARLSFFTPNACDFPIEPIISVAQDQVVTEAHDPGFWQASWDVSMLRRFVKASFPKPKVSDGPDEVMERLFEELAREMGVHGVERFLSWPAVLILAEKAEDI
ncbi:S-adenosyl-L-methionine-dependent methyltransferase [Xylaria cubensis]|nr:S-adenosyl-L-methionine-dependent methyltransferase [Xylaria cubensis]